MECRTIKPYLERYVDGEVDTGLRRRVQNHLTRCPACRRRCDEIRELGGLFAAAPPVPPVPNGLHARIMAEARRRQGAGETRPVWTLAPLRALFAGLSTPMRLAAGVTALLAVVTGIGLTRHDFRQENPAGNHDINGFEWFAPVPPASMGAAYLAMIEEPQYEERQ